MPLPITVYLYTVRTDNTPRVRFSLTLDKELEIEVALGWTLRAHALLMDLHATDVVGSSAYSRLDSCLLRWIVCAVPCCQARGRSGNCRRFLHDRLQTKPMKRFAAYKQGVGDPDQRLAGCGRIRNGHWRGFGAVTDFHRSLRGSTSTPRGSLPERPCRRHESRRVAVEERREVHGSWRRP
jgi:hypothetical protein